MTLIVRPGFMFDADASTYIEAVEAVDLQALETNVRYAINNFVIGCKQDNIWSAIKAGCILSGARTRVGSFIDLKTCTQILTSSNFVDGDYLRKTGLKGNESNKYLDSGFNPNSNNTNQEGHMACYVTENSTTSSRYYMGARSSPPTLIYELHDNSGNLAGGINSGTLVNLTGAGNTSLGFVGTSRSSNTQTVRGRGVQASDGTSGTSKINLNISVFARNVNGSVSGYSNRRMAFYSIGEALDLAQLDARVTDLINAIGAAIP